MLRTILPLKGMSEDEIRETKSKKISNMRLIYEIGLRGLDLNYVLPHWNIEDKKQIEDDSYSLSEEAEKYRTSVMIRSAHFRRIEKNKLMAEVSMPVRVDKITPNEIYEAIVSVLDESREKIEKTGITDYKLNLILCSCFKNCPRSGMIHVHENRFEFYTLYGNVAALLREDYEHDIILTDGSFNVLETMPRKKERKMDIRDGGFVAENVPPDKQEILSLSESEISLFENDINAMVKSFPGKDVEAMWLQHDDGIYYSYLDVKKPYLRVKKVELDEKWVTYSPKINLSKLKGKTVYVPLHILNSKHADEAITFIAGSKPKAVVLPKQISDVAHKMKILREAGVYYETDEHAS